MLKSLYNKTRNLNTDFETFWLNQGGQMHVLGYFDDDSIVVDTCFGVEFSRCIGFHLVSKVFWHSINISLCVWKIAKLAEDVIFLGVHVFRWI